LTRKKQPSLNKKKEIETDRQRQTDRHGEIRKARETEKEREDRVHEKREGWKDGRDRAGKLGRAGSIKTKVRAIAMVYNNSASTETINSSRLGQL